MEAKEKFFLKEYKKFKTKQNKQIKAGKNDFNLLTTVLKYHDEVNLHSKMIASLLDPKGLHYQSSKFLELFLKQVELEYWFDDVNKVEVNREHENIDLYLTDGCKHLIIENKIWAGDQPCQIIKYVNIIVNNPGNKFYFPEENPKLGKNEIQKLDKNKIQVLYLTPRAKEVSSGHKLTEDGQYIFYKNSDKLKAYSEKMNKAKTIKFPLKNYKSKYKKITYKKHVLKWLKSCLDEVSDIENLKESIEQYKNVVEVIHNNYEKNVVDFYDYINNSKKKETLVEHLFEDTLLKNGINEEELRNTKGKMLYRFFRNFEELNLENVNYDVSQKKKEQKKLIYSSQKCRNWFNKIIGKKQYKNFGSFYKINDKYLLFIFIGTTYYHFGIVQHDNYILEDIADNYILKNIEDNSKIEGLEYKTFKKFKTIPKRYSKEFELVNNLDIFHDYENSQFNKELKVFLALLPTNNKEN